jgi:protein TonB
MRKLFFLALMGIAMCVNTAKAQNTDKVYDFVSIDKQPEFPGGMKRFYEYLGQAIKYPALAKRNNVEGKVFLSFVVEKNGFLTDIKVTKGLGSGTDEEATRVLKNSPAWNPGLIGGKPIRVKYNINVNFSLGSAKSR